MLVILPPGRWAALDLGDLWMYRDLLYFFIWRDIKVRYKQTVVGAGWALLQPLLTMVIFSVCFGRLAKLPSNGIPYPLFAYAGLLPWTFFATGVNGAGVSLVQNMNLVSKIYFPRILIPVGVVLAGLLDLGISFIALAGLMIWYRVPLGPSVLLLPLLVVLTAAVTLGTGIWMAALNVKYRDVKYVLPFFIQVGMFVTPIIYPAGLLPERWRWLLNLNPMAGIVEAYRSALYNLPIAWSSLGVSALVTAVLLVTAAYYFRSLEASFADII